MPRTILKILCIAIVTMFMLQMPGLLTKQYESSFCKNYGSAIKHSTDELPLLLKCHNAVRRRIHNFPRSMDTIRDHGMTKTETRICHTAIEKVYNQSINYLQTLHDLVAETEKQKRMYKRFCHRGKATQAFYDHLDEVDGQETVGHTMYDLFQRASLLAEAFRVDLVAAEDACSLKGDIGDENRKKEL